MMRLASLWEFVAGESPIAPLSVFFAIIVALLVTRLAPGAGALAGVAFVAVIADGLVAAPSNERLSDKPDRHGST